LKVALAGKMVLISSFLRENTVQRQKCIEIKSEALNNLTGCETSFKQAFWQSAEKKENLRVLGGELCGKKLWLCGIVQSCKQTNMPSPGPKKNPVMEEFLDQWKVQQLSS